MAYEITELLLQWTGGDAAALEKLMPFVYDELRRLARNHLRRERRGLTLEPTVLVHEAYLRLIDQRSVSFENRAQFYGLAARLMRNIIIDHSRRRCAGKRGGGGIQVSLSYADRMIEKQDVGMESLELALQELEAIKPVHCQIVELRFFGGLTTEEIAIVLSLSPTTIARRWNFARAWLIKTMSRDPAERGKPLGLTEC